MPPIQCRLKSLNIPIDRLKKRVLLALHDSDKINEARYKNKSLDKEIISTDFYSLKKEFQNRFDHFHSKTYLEIACGTGDFICTMAEKNPDINFIGVDYALPVIERAVVKAEQAQLRNLLFYLGRVEDFLKYDIKDETFDLVMINFPDPWPKKRHYKRRIVQHPLIENIAQGLTDKGTLITATDINDLHLWNLEIISSNKIFKDIQKNSLTPPIEAYHTASIYELKGREFNRQIYYTCHLKSPSL